MKNRYTYFSQGKVTLGSEVPSPLHPGWCRLKVIGCGICGTDLHLLNDSRMHPDVRVRPGHEVSAEIVEDPSGIFSTGDLVLLHPVIPCGQCTFCHEGRENLCRQQKVLGIQESGGLADYVQWPASRLIHIPQELDPLFACLVPDAVATAYHALQKLELTSTRSLCVIGAGGVGTNVLQLAQLLRPELRTCGIVRTTATVARLRDSGIAAVTSGPSVDVEVKKIIGDVDAVIDFSGTPEALALASRMVRRGGVIVSGAIGEHPADLRISLTTLCNREISLKGTYASTLQSMKDAASLIAQHSHFLALLTTHRFRLEDIDAAFTTLYSRPPGLGRIVVEP